MAEEQPPDSAERVADVLQQLRSGVRQRLAESAVQADASDEARQGLLAVRSREDVQEPVPGSPPPRLGRPVVLARKIVFRLFLKWWARPILEQQNAFNQAAGRLFRDVVEKQEQLHREVRLLAGRVAALERSGDHPSPPKASGE